MGVRTVASRAVRTPRLPVVAALVAMTSSVGIALVGTLSRPLGVPAILAGYLLGAVVTTALVQVHRGARIRASASPWFNPERGLDRLAAGVLAVALLAGAWHAFALATEWAK